VSGPERTPDRLHLADIVRAIAEVEKDSAEGREAFLSDHRTRKAVLLDLVYLVESVSELSPAFRKANPLVDWGRLPVNSC
jgi:uncharacterized protein with HEPN domain